MSTSLRLILVAGLLPFAVLSLANPHGSVASSRPSAASSVLAVSPAVLPKAVNVCGAGKDLIVRALEVLRADSTPDQLGDADQFLRRSLDVCSDMGDAWYFRSLVDAKLNRAPKVAFDLRQLARFPSEASALGINPFVLSTPQSKSGPPTKPIRNRWALVIGIGSFEPGVPSLKYTRSDATAFRDALIDPKVGGFPSANVKLLTDREATLRGIKENLNWLARTAAPDDMVVIYIASHGSARDADTREANYIVTSDTEADTADHLYATALPMTDLSYAVATRLRSLRTAVFIDTCFSEAATETARRTGTPAEAAGVSSGTLAQITQGTGRVIFAASRKEQESLESPTLQHGYFTYYLLQGLREHPGQPLTTLFAYVQSHVSGQVSTDYKLYGLHQEPVLSRSSETTDFALGAPAAAVVELR